MKFNLDGRYFFSKLERINIRFGLDLIGELMMGSFETITRVHDINLSSYPWGAVISETVR